MTRRLRQIAEPFVVAAPAGARVRTRLVLSGADGSVLRAVGGHLGALAGADLGVRCGQGRLDARAAAACRAERKQALTGRATSRWAGAITRTSNDAWDLAERNLRAEARSLRARTGRIRRRLAAPAGGRDGRVRGYASGPERWEKQRRAQALTARLAEVEARLAEGRVSVCRGGRGLARGRHHLDAAGLSQDQWRQRWRARRWFITADGEKDKAWGNETVRWHPEEGWLEVKLPAPLAHLANRPHGRYRLCCRVGFAYRGEQVAAQAATGAVRYDICYDPGKDRWHLDASWTFPPRGQANLEELRRHRVLAVDLNAGHLAAWVIEPSGNPVGPPRTVPLDLAGLAATTRDGRLRAAISELIWAARAGGCAAIVVENLDFARARAEGRERSGGRPSRGRRGRSFRRQVASIPTGRFRDRLVQMTANAGLAVIAVDPAYTSRWGALHWLQPLTTQFSPMTTGHHAAAVVIGRRGLGQRARRRERRDSTRPEDRRESCQLRRAARTGSGRSGRPAHQETRRPQGPTAARSRAQDPTGRTGIPGRPGRRRPFAPPRGGDVLFVTSLRNGAVMAREADVIIVGAGLSGLIAAREVLTAGYEPLILEADQRVGGRILTEDVEGVPLELGAQWIGDTHHRMEALASELGVGIYPQFEDGETSYEFAGEVLRERAFHAKYADELSGVERVLRKLDQMAETVPVDAPWRAPEADAWDRVTVGQWYDSQGLSPVARTLLEICTVGILAVPTVEVSLLCLLFNVVVCGVTAELLAESEGGAQTKRLVGGTSQIPLRLAAALGDRVLLDSPVLTIDYTDDRVIVTCRGGLVAAGRQVIVALSPTLAGRIMYDPPLPGVRDQLTQRMPQASAHKMFAIYDEPFWRPDGLNAQLISEVGPARMSNDSCLPDEAGGPGIILAFLEGESARVAGRWPAEQRQQALCAELGRHFGRRAAEPQRIVERGWADREWIRGCYNSNMGPCGLLHFGAALGKPIGPIKWAATETANAWSGYMEGAVEAGHRAAREALEGL